MKPKSKKAFTLIELLVVIGITGLLMGILMPALSKARAEGKRVYCLNNLRQMAIAAANYTLSNDDYYPIAHYSQKTNFEIFGYNWDFTTIRNPGTDETDVVAGILWQGQTVEEIHQCPSERRTLMNFLDGLSPATVFLQQHLFHLYRDFLSL